MDLRIGSGLAVLALGVAVAFGAQANPAERSMPSCALTSLDDGQPVELDEFQGSLLWVDFWASWCDSCAASFAFLDQLEREFRAQGLRVVGVNLDEDPADAAAFLAKHPVAFAQLADDGGSCPRQFGVPGMPAAYLIDRRGVIRHQHLGFRAGDARRIRALVNELVAAGHAAPREPLHTAGAP